MCNRFNNIRKEWRNIINPIKIFKEWYKEECQLSKAAITSACCLSTIGLDGFPNSRFISLKDIINDNFIITGSLNSLKGMEIKRNNKVAITFWWTETSRQVRIQGTAKRINDHLADKYFNERDYGSKVVSFLSRQGEKIENYNSLEEELSKYLIKSNEVIKRPADWGGYSINPLRIELMEFRLSRLHYRKLFELYEQNWEMFILSP